MAESQRKATTSGSALASDGQSKKDLLTLLGFLIGGIGIVSGMLWLADGLSTDFKLTTTSFIVFVVGMAIMTAIFLLNKFVIKD